jgi:hypothetical protein
LLLSDFSHQYLSLLIILHFLFQAYLDSSVDSAP